MDTTKALCLALVVSLYITAVGGHVAERFAYPRERQSPRKKPRLPRPAHVDLLLFKLLPIELRHQVYRYLFKDLAQAFHPDVNNYRYTFSFITSALLDTLSNEATDRTPPILRVDRFLADDAMPVLLECCWIELRLFRGGNLSNRGNEALDYFNPAQLHPPWTHLIQYLTINARALRFLRKYNAPARLPGLQLVMCRYEMVLDNKVAIVPSHHDDSDLEPFYGMDIPRRIPYQADRPRTWKWLSARNINNITTSLAFKVQLHEFMVEMNELFPRCEQLVILDIVLCHKDYENALQMVSVQRLLYGTGSLTNVIGLYRNLHRARPMVCGQRR
jgi:hypothetical protein